MFKLILEKILGNRDPQAKIDAKKKAKAKSQIKCPDNMTPHLVSTNPYRYICKPKDKKKARLMKKIIKKVKIQNPQQFKKKYQKAQDTKDFRYKI